MTYLTCSAQCWLDSTSVSLWGLFLVVAVLGMAVLLGVTIALVSVSVWRFLRRVERVYDVILLPRRRSDR